MTDGQKIKLQEKYILVDSEIWKDVCYAIDRHGKGMHIIAGNQSIPVAADDVEQFAKELTEVWNTMQPRMVKT